MVHRIPMTDIGKWLRRHGLGKYTEVFTDNAIAFDVLPELTEDDLKEFGVPFGDRKRLLKAIAAREVKSAKSEDNLSPAECDPASSSPDFFPTGEAERRQLTVMFCDLVGSTGLSQRLDPEDLRDISRAYQNTCKASIERFEGYVARYMGDGVLAYFGFPLAHEDDAERAIRAGLLLVRAMEHVHAETALPKDLRLEVRIGIATGPVVVGDLIGEGASQESAVVGETPNLAARLQRLAPTNAVVVSSNTHDLAAGEFEYEDMGERRVKGIARPVSIWRVIAPSATESRFEAVHGAGLTAFVGRAQEVALLLDRWQAAKEGEGQVVLLSGEAGIGKSRIIQVLRERLAADSYTPVQYQCSPHHVSSTLYPVVRQLEFAVGFSAGDSADQKLAKLQTLLGQATEVRSEKISLFATLLSVPLPSRYAPLDLSPQEQKGWTLNVLVDQLRGLAVTQPVLFAVEDAHWIDPTTTELVDLMVDAIVSLPVLLLITFRPDFDCPWAVHSHATTLKLNRLTHKQTETLATHVAGGRPLPGELLHQIMIKTDGVPLFVEELTKTIVESGLLEASDTKSGLTSSLPPLAIPNTLQDSLMARLDRLATVKELAQLASVIGREFTERVLAAASPLSEHEVRDGLTQLMNAGLIFRRGTGRRVSYRFKHALVQDAAYESLLKSKRRQLHSVIAKILEGESPETAPELLAHHYTQAGITDVAVGYWKMAAERASARSADLEAVAHASRALELINVLPAKRARDELEFRLCVELARALVASIGHAAPEVERTVSRALELWEDIGETPMIFPVLFSRWIFHFVSGPLFGARQLATEIQRLAESQQDPLPKLLGERTLATCAIMEGEPVTARKHTERALALYDSERHRSMAFTFGQDGRIASLSFSVLSLWYTGQTDQARARARVALEEARALGHANTLGQTLSLAAGLLPALCRDGRSLEQGVEELVAHTAGHKLPFWQAFANATLGRLRFTQGRYDEAIDAIVRGIAGYQEQQVVRWCPTFYAWLAEAHAARGAHSDALNALDVGRDLINAYGERWFEAELYRITGEMRRNMNPHDIASAERLFVTASDVARRHQAKSLELRVATSRARLYRDQGRLHEAHDVLDAIYGWFTEGFDTPDLIEAERLLHELS